jgi:hypothetical protein
MLRIVCLLLSLFSLAEGASCLILLDREGEAETVGRYNRYYLTTKLQSALAEQATPILLHASLWDSFIERRVYFEQKLKQPGSPEYKIFNLYFEIQQRLDSLNDKEAVQQINKEFYQNNIQTNAFHYQLLLNYLTPLENWSVYKRAGFYLLIPNLEEQGFNIAQLEKVVRPEDTPLHYFQRQKPALLIDALYAFFLLNSEEVWDIVLSGHGGSFYHEFNKQGRVTWEAEPVISDLRVDEFKAVLAFFNSEVKTHLFHYSGCYSGGNHLSLAFDKTYDFPIICDTLTDCYSYCKWNNKLPSEEKKLLTAEDLRLSEEHWRLDTESPYRWSKFFSEIKEIDFSPASLERLPEILSSITHSLAADISLLRPAKGESFFPIYPIDTFKINEPSDISLHGVKTVLIESAETGSVELDSPARFLSIKPGDATHFIKKLQCSCYLDLASAFWQSEGQNFNKTFIVEECIFPNGPDSPFAGDKIVLQKVLIDQQKNYLIRIFFTLGGEAMMMAANKLDSDELNEKAHVLQIVNLSQAAKKAYEEHYYRLGRSSLASGKASEADEQAG